MLEQDEIQPIRIVLTYLAGRWRANQNNTVQAKEIVKHYNELLCFLINTGWNEGLSLEAELPDELMPQEYLALLDMDEV
ncbi:MAG: hypothetical protein DRR19_20930 [Candidatus Parabeggiatoa sp. nov. 1]|nr:MAG: hypothetical protein DRR19_20930 [Gammaproteobacteria bacterium]